VKILKKPQASDDMNLW